MPEADMEFDDALRGSLLESVTVGRDRMLFFALIGGTEIRV